MPRYVYSCKEHGIFELTMRVAEHSRIVSCTECGADSVQVITPPTVIIPSHMSATGVSAYESPVSGRLITNQRERKNDLAASGCIEYDPGMKQDADRRVIENEKRLDKEVESFVTKEFETMSSDKRESLYKDLSSGADVEVQRI